jgi:hypothetical protein
MSKPWLRSFLDSPKVNFGGACLSAVAEVVSWTSNATPAYVTPVAFIATVFFLGRLAWTQYVEAQAFRDSARPRFEIVFEPPAVEPGDADADGRPYLQVLRFQQRVPSPLPIGSQTLKLTFCDRRYRVGIRNLSTAIVPKVRVVLAACKPGGNFVHVAHALLVMDSDPPAAERDLAPNESGQPTLFFDVVKELGQDGRTPGHVSFCFANDNLSQPVHGDSFEIRLRAEGGGYSHERTFAISKPYLHPLKKHYPVIMEPL